MPEPYWPKLPTRYCKRTYNYRPDDLIQIFGDMDTDDLARRMTCEKGHTGGMNVETFVPSGREAVGLRIRRLVAIKIKRVPVWRED